MVSEAVAETRVAASQVGREEGAAQAAAMEALVGNGVEYQVAVMAADTGEAVERAGGAMELVQTVGVARAGVARAGVVVGGASRVEEERAAVDWAAASVGAVARVAALKVGAPRVEGLTVVASAVADV